MAAVIFGNLLPRWFLGTLITHRWNNADTVPKAAAAGWEAGRGDSNWWYWCKDFSCRHQGNLMAIERKQIHANPWIFRNFRVLDGISSLQVIHVASWDVETVETQLVAQDSGRFFPAQVTAIISPWLNSHDVSGVHYPPWKGWDCASSAWRGVFFRLCCLGISQQSRAGNLPIDRKGEAAIQAKLRIRNSHVEDHGRLFNIMLRHAGAM